MFDRGREDRFRRLESQSQRGASQPYLCTRGGKCLRTSMKVLIIKLGATGDVVRTTPLLRQLDGLVSWITAENNLPLLEASIGNCVVFHGKIASASPIPPTIW